MMIKSYLRGKIKTILCFIVFIFVFIFTASLYNMPRSQCFYVLMLTCFFGMVFLGWGFYRYCQKMSLLNELGNRVEFGALELPMPSDGVEKKYQDMINQLQQCTREVISKSDMNKTEMINYYTLWVHQIKTPIAAMRLLLQSRNFDDKDSMQMELFKIEQYVEMVLQYLRLGSEQTDYILKEQSLDKIIKGAVKKYSTMFIKKKISLEYAPVNYTVISDEKWLSFVLEQILSNGLKYTNKGKISIYMEDSQLVIEDTGIGINSEDIPRVTERGYTGYNGREDKKSTGIGLYLCSNILEKLGHAMTIESKVGKGTRVKLLLVNNCIDNRD